jgi:hypothetical protein
MAEAVLMDMSNAECRLGETKKERVAKLNASMRGLPLACEQTVL